MALGRTAVRRVTAQRPKAAIVQRRLMMLMKALHTSTDSSIVGNGIGQNRRPLRHVTARRPKAAIVQRRLMMLMKALYTSTENSIAGNGIGQNCRLLRHRPKTRGRYRSAASDDADDANVCCATASLQYLTPGAPDRWKRPSASKLQGCTS